MFSRWKTVAKEHAETIAAELEANGARGERMLLEPITAQTIHGAVTSRATVALTNERLIIWTGGDRSDLPLAAVLDVRDSDKVHSGSQGGSRYVIIRTNAADVVICLPDDVAPEWTTAITKALAERK